MENKEYIEQRLKTIWENPKYSSLLDNSVMRYGYWFPYNDNPKGVDILITGINPSRAKNDESISPEPISVKDLLRETNSHPYWMPLRRIVYEDRDSKRTKDLDYRDMTGVLDLFYFRNKDQGYLSNIFLKKMQNEGIPFIIDQLRLSQERIEKLCPKLIIVKNKESQAYWGRLDSPQNRMIWMGYKFKDIPNRFSNTHWSLAKIVGIDKENILGLTSSTLVVNQTLVLFVPHINQYTKIEDRPTPEIIEELLDIAGNTNRL